MQIWAMSRTSKLFVLSDDDLTILNQLVAKGKVSMRKINRARSLLLSHQRQSPLQISVLLGLSPAPVYNVRSRYRVASLEAAITDKPRPGQPRKVTPEVEAKITQIACRDAPDGRTRWRISLINDRLVKLDVQIDDESVRSVLKKVSLSRGLKSSGALGS